MQDNRKAPQNMFRPLLSSVPSTTFYVGKMSSTHAITLKNSSVTTSSKTISDQGASVLPHPESNYYCRDDIVGESEKMLCPDIQEEIFAFDKEDEELGSEPYGDIHRGHLTKGGPINSDDIEVINAQSTEVHLCDVDDLRSTTLCSLCGCSYDATDPIEMEIKLCKECRKKENLPSVALEETLAVAADRPPVMSIGTPEKCENLDSLAMAVFGSPQIEEIDESKYKANGLRDPSAFHVEVQEDNVINGNGEEHLSGGWGPADGGTSSQESEHLTNHPNTEVAAAEGAGISLLLKRSNSTKGLVVQGRALTASTILPNEDLSYARETTTSMRSSIGHGTFSSSSSIDLSSSRQTETRMQRQFSGKKSDIDNYKYEVKSQGVGSSLSGTSSYSYQAVGLVTATSELNFEGSFGDTGKNISAEMAVASLDEQPFMDVVGTDLAYSSPIQSAVLQEDNSEHGESGKKTNASALQLSGDVADNGPVDDLVACHDDIQETTNLENCEDLQENVRNEANPKASSATENTTLDVCVSVSNEMSASTNGSLVSTSEIEVRDCHQCEARSEVVDTYPNLNIPIDEVEEPLKKDTNTSNPEPTSSDPIVDIFGQSFLSLSVLT